MSSFSSAPVQQFVQNSAPTQISHYQPQQQYYHVPVQMDGGSQVNNIQRGFPTLEKRATHNATERARREILNVKFQELANSIPALSNVRKPSKSVIVQKSLEHVEELQRMSDRKDNAIRTLSERNSNLRVEVGKLRALLGHPALPPENDQDVLSAISSIQFNSAQHNRPNYPGIRQPPHVVVYTTSLQGQGMGAMPPNNISQLTPNNLTPMTPSTIPLAFDQNMQQNNFGVVNVNTFQQPIHSVHYTNMSGQNRSNSLSDEDDDGTLLNSSIPVTTSGMNDLDIQGKQGYEDSLFNNLLQGDLTTTTFQSLQTIQTASNGSSSSNQEISNQSHFGNPDSGSHSPDTNNVSTPLTLPQSHQSYSLDQSQQHQNIQISTPLPISVSMQNQQTKIIQTSYSNSAPAQMFTPLTPLLSQQTSNQQNPQYLYNNSMIQNTPPPEPMYMQHQQMQTQQAPQTLQATQFQQVHPQQITYQSQFTPQNTIYVTPAGTPTQNSANGHSHEASMIYQRSFAYSEPQQFQTQYSAPHFVQPGQHVMVSQQIPQQHVIQSHGPF
ncbi:hypothetical protein HK096_004496 [Nowakowskiella sp. JEL0078]|nr:hypothetical protein HK096_004496 [Nowakowskiella sp. JEL0078]